MLVWQYVPFAGKSSVVLSLVTASSPPLPLLLPFFLSFLFFASVLSFLLYPSVVCYGQEATTENLLLFARPGPPVDTSKRVRYCSDLMWRNRPTLYIGLHVDWSNVIFVYMTLIQCSDVIIYIVPSRCQPSLCNTGVDTWYVNPSPLFLSTPKTRHDRSVCKLSLEGWEERRLDWRSTILEPASAMEYGTSFVCFTPPLWIVPSIRLFTLACDRTPLII